MLLYILVHADPPLKSLILCYHQRVDLGGEEVGRLKKNWMD